MIKPNFIFKVTSVFVFCLLASATSFAQTETRAQAEPNYEVVLQVIVGSNDAALKNNLPANLSTVAKNLRNSFSFSNYNLSDTYISRIGSRGSLDYKTVSNRSAQTQTAGSPTFLGWSLGNLRSMPDANNRKTIQMETFRFDARMPIISSNSVINYESIGLTAQKISLPENAPALIGTLSSSKPGETIFLVLTIKPVE